MKLSIALVGPLPPPPAGMANQAEQLGRLLRQEGVHVEHVRTNAPYRPAWIGKVRGLRGLFRLVPYVFDLWRTAGRVQLVHVMANSGWAWHLVAAPAVWIGRLRGAAVIINYRGGDAAEFFGRSIRLVRPTMRLASQRLVPSGYLHQVFGKFGLASEIVPNIIDLDRFKAKSRDAASRASGARLLVARNLEPLYDIATAIRAFGIVLREFPDARLVVAGGGPERANLEALAAEIGISARVEFTGPVDNKAMSKLYEQTDVFVNTSLHDNMPVSILEALAVGVPVVSSDVCGIPYLVEHRKSALLVPPRDPALIAACVCEILRDDNLRHRLTATGHAVVQRYSWQFVRPLLLDCYSRSTAGRRVRTEAQLQ